MSGLRTMAVMLSLVLMASVAWADCGECEGTCEGTCEAGQCEGVCPVTTALAKLPKMTFKVGDEEMCCSYSAKSLADSSGEPVMFVVAEKAHDSEAAAMVALADATEKFVSNFAQPKTCAVSGTTTIAGQQLKCSVTAGKMASTVDKAMKSVQMTYKVGNEQSHCPNEAKSLAAKSGEKTQFVIGEKATSCSVDARIKLAQARYRAAVQALAKMTAEQDKEASSEI